MVDKNWKHLLFAKNSTLGTYYNFSNFPNNNRHEIAEKNELNFANKNWINVNSTPVTSK